MAHRDLPRHRRQRGDRIALALGRPWPRLSCAPVAGRPNSPPCARVRASSGQHCRPVSGFGPRCA
eukprot:5282218-Lingulodinium_polyedra.AAC.1